MIPVHVIGASGRSGAALCRSLAADGVAVVGVVRNPAKFRALGLPGEARMADLGDAAALRAALGEARRVVSCAHARHAGAILAAMPDGAPLVLLGSTRKFTRWPDGHGNGVLAGEAAFLASGRPGVMLHPTMIYGAEGENNVQRLATWLRRLPVVPLPGGGRALVQPVHQGDVTRSIRAALARDWTTPRTVVIAGGTALPYAEFVRAIARAAGLGEPRIVSLPAAPLMAAARLTRLLPFLPAIGPDEIRRLMEDKAFPTTDMTALLGVSPIGLDEGLRLTFRDGAAA